MNSATLKKEFVDGSAVPRTVGEFWTAKQRQASSLHEISYRACFKPQLPRYFIERYSKEGNTIYDPFMGRGTTIIEAALLKRNVIGNDVNPLSKILAVPRLDIPEIDEIEERLAEITFSKKAKADIDLSMFYHPETEAEIVSHQNGARAQAANHDPAREFFRRETGDVHGEGQDQRLLDAFLRHQGGAARGRHHQSRRALRRHNARRMRIEHQHRRLPAALGGNIDNPPQDAPVAGVDAIEVADRKRAGAEIGGHFVEAAIDPHGTPPSTRISIPSKASRMCGGSMLSARSWPRS